jgi:hypothetical protein
MNQEYAMLKIIYSDKSEIIEAHKEAVMIA